ncbi:hypothetical protein Hanom_Chr10g00908921 [Helianthus anomalus]
MLHHLIAACIQSKMWDMRKHNRKRRNTYDLRRIHIQRLQVWYPPIRINS